MDTLVVKDINIKKALENNWCTTTDILDYLTTVKPSVNTFIIYNDLCLVDTSGNHYLSNNNHFLKDVQFSLAYQSIYILRELPLTVYSQKENSAVTIASIFPSDLTVSNPTMSAITQWMNRSLSNEIVQSILPITGYLNETNAVLNSISLFLKGNNVPSVLAIESIFESSSLQQLLFDYDLTDVMLQIISKEPLNPILKEWYEHSCCRLGLVERINKNYYIIIRPYYEKVIKKLLEVCIPSTHEIKNIAYYLNYTIIDKTLMDNPLVQKIINLNSIEEQAYVLGIPIHMYQITPALILNRCKDLCLLGESLYIKQYVSDYNKKYFDIFCTKVDDTDITGGLSLYDYNLFDIVPYNYQTNTILYVRDEANMVQTKLKDRFNCSINPIFLQELTNRQKIAIKFNFGRAESICDIFDRLLTNKNKEKAIEISNSGSNNSNSSGSGNNSSNIRMLRSLLSNPTANTWTFSTMLDSPTSLASIGNEFLSSIINL
jgi:hypothetical protein